MNNAQKVFNILYFQYGPLEKKLLSFFKQEGKSDLISQYKRLSYAKKIKALDLFAATFGL